LLCFKWRILGDSVWLKVVTFHRLFLSAGGG
jgi:hypothetical protein